MIIKGRLVGTRGGGKEKVVIGENDQSTLYICIHIHLCAYIYENSIMKPTKTIKKGKFRGSLRKSNVDGVNLTKVHYMSVCKYHNETTLYN
jgi:hypothetical protein